MAKPAVQDQVIGTVIRERREELRVSVRRLNGKQMLDIRVFIENELGQMIPTSRGVSLSEKDWVQLRGILQRLKSGGQDVGASVPA
jgi:hypothetical protein